MKFELNNQNEDQASKHQNF